MMRAIGGRRPVPQAVPVEPVDGWQHLRRHAARRIEEALDEIPGVLRRFRTFLAIASITMVAFAAGLLIVLWRAVA